MEVPVEEKRNGNGDSIENVFTASQLSESKLREGDHDQTKAGDLDPQNACRIVSLCPGNSDANAKVHALVPLSSVDHDNHHGVLDMLGNKMAFTILREKRDLDFVLSWLSTLGGACSALGDKSNDWALEAGKISLKQLKIGMKLGDPLITARCQLYIAISFIQRGKLREAKQIVENIYHYVKYQLPEDTDPKLIRMCLGIWAKLQYHWQLERKQKRDLGQIAGTPSRNLKAICM